MLKAARTMQVFTRNPWFLCCAPQTVFSLQNPTVLAALSGTVFIAMRYLTEHFQN